MMRESFSLLKVDKSEQEKIYAKIYSSKLPNQDFSCRFWQLCGAKRSQQKKKPIPHPTKLINMPLRGQVVFSVKHLFCGNVKTITCIVDEVLVEKLFNQFQLLMTLRIGMSQIWRVMRTFKKTFSTEKFLLKDFSQFLSVPDAKRDPGNMPKEWRRFHKDSWVFNRVTIAFPNSHFAISSSQAS